ncbi:MAG TPA: hypothetical protein PLO44_01650 [Candidatus Paceibacterota bacterium]|nr:hypothetical protein [Candidatus Paceibacterota bacterium]
MKLKNIHRTILSFGIISIIIVSPILNTKKTYAQTVGFGATNSYSSGGSLTSIVGDLSPLIKQLPGCTSVLGTGDLFSGIKKVFSGKSNKIDKYTNVDSLTDTVTQTAMELEGIPTYDASLQQMVGDIKVQQTTQGKTLDRVDKSTSSDNKNNACLNSIGKAVVKMIVDKMTVSIVNWINTGNSGDSFFVKNPSKYFKDIAKEQLLSFKQELSDSSKYPFAKSFLTNSALSFNQKFQDNAQYSLSQVQGGWNTFSAITNQANNPFGFALMASNEMQSRILGEATQKTQELAQSGGFLSQERCVDPEGVTKEEHLSALNAGNRYLDEQGTSVLGGRYIDEQGTNTQARICKQWEIVTPGKTIAETLTKKMDNSENALLSADTLNDAIAAILDAVLAKTSSKLTNEGLSALSDSDYSTSYDINNYDDNGLADYQSSQTDKDFSDYQRDSSPWLQSHPDFDIRTDITQALIDEQRTYINKLKELNYTLLHTGDSTQTGYGGLIPTIYQLDYCIPGPHPGWEDDAQAILNKKTNALANIVSEVKGIADTTGYALLNTFTLGIGTAIIDWGNSAMNCGNDSAGRSGDYIAEALSTMTGMTNLPSQEQLCTMNGFQFVTNEIMDGYSKLIKKYFNVKNSFMPSVTAEAENEFNKNAGYEQMIEDNNGAIAFQEGIIKRLQTIKDGVANLNENSATYENDLVAWKNSFARISTSLVSGGDIAHIDDLTNQAKDELKYVYEDLLQGPAGCEKELSSYPTWLALQPVSAGGNGWGANIGDKKRPAYLKPHLYNYNLPIVPQGGWVYSGGNGNATGFLGAVIFGECWGNPDCKTQLNLNGSNNAWILDVIDLHKGSTGAALNFNSPGYTGTAKEWENALQIY